MPAAGIIVLIGCVVAMSAGSPAPSSDIPLAIRGPALEASLFRATTHHGLTASEYAMLRAADRGAIRVVDGYKVSVVVDQRRRLALIERSCCALQEWIVTRADSNFGNATAVTLRDARIGGVEIGSSVSVVEQRFGWLEPSIDRGGESLLRYRHARNHDCSTFYTFGLEKGSVRAISVKNAC